jgi:hypothetical protein
VRDAVRFTRASAAWSSADPPAAQLDQRCLQAREALEFARCQRVVAQRDRPIDLEERAGVKGIGARKLGALDDGAQADARLRIHA